QPHPPSGREPRSRDLPVHGFPSQRQWDVGHKTAALLAVYVARTPPPGLRRLEIPADRGPIPRGFPLRWLAASRRSHVTGEGASWWARTLTRTLMLSVSAAIRAAAGPLLLSHNPGWRHPLRPTSS